MPKIRHEIHDLHGRERARYLKSGIGIPILAHGGREAIINRGSTSYTPAPGEAPSLFKS